MIYIMSLKWYNLQNRMDIPLCFVFKMTLDLSKATKIWFLFNVSHFAASAVEWWGLMLVSSNWFKLKTNEYLKSSLMMAGNWPKFYGNNIVKMFSGWLPLCWN